MSKAKAKAKKGIKVRAICDVTSISEGWGHVQGTINLVKKLMDRGVEIDELEFLPISQVMNSFNKYNYIKGWDQEKDDEFLSEKIKSTLGKNIKFKIAEPNDAMLGNLKQFDLSVSGAIDKTVMIEWKRQYDQNFGCKKMMILTPAGFKKSFKNHVRKTDKEAIHLKNSFFKSSDKNTNIKNKVKKIVIYKADRCKKVLDHIINVLEKDENIELTFVADKPGDFGKRLKNKGIKCSYKASLQPDDFKELLLNSDLCICEGQNTASECISYGTPVLHTPKVSIGNSVNTLIREEVTLKVFTQPNKVNAKALIQSITKGTVQVAFKKISSTLKDNDLLDEAITKAVISINKQEVKQEVKKQKDIKKTSSKIDEIIELLGGNNQEAGMTDSLIKQAQIIGEKVKKASKEVEEIIDLLEGNNQKKSSKKSSAFSR